jgi:phosphoribosylanthranilate isomerase
LPHPILKICGNTSAEDAKQVGESGAEYCGILVDVGFSERSLTLDDARRVAAASGTKNVVLLCDPDVALAEDVAREIQPHAIQLLCQESPTFLAELKSRLSCEVWKSIHLPAVEGQASVEAYVDAGADVLLVDSVDSSEGFLRMGGTGKVADWAAVALVIASVSVPVFLAGGIGPDNVRQAIEALHPYGIDLCSGVEASRGEKDPEKIEALVGSIRAASERIEGGAK